jgi:hypothetical protein
LRVRVFVSMWEGDFSPVALAVSLALHGAAIFAISPAGPIDHANPQAVGPTRDSWSGNTFDVELVEGRAKERGRNGAQLEQHSQPAASEQQGPAATEPEGPERSGTALVFSATTALGRSPKPALPDSDAEVTEEAQDGRGPAVVSPAPRGQVAALGSPAQDAPPSPAHPGPATSEAASPEAGREATGDSVPPGALGGTYGAAGPLEGIRDLGRAFTRALPAAALEMDAAWRSLPWGAGAEARITFTLGEKGELVDAKIHDPQPPSYLAVLLRRSVLLLKRGHFALQANQQAPGEQTFRVSVRLSRRAPSDNPFAEPYHIMQRGFTAPTPDRPGHAFFTSASGRHVDLTVTAVDPEEETRAGEGAD